MIRTTRRMLMGAAAAYIVSPVRAAEKKYAPGVSDTEILFGETMP